jgi:hypothetical protein
LTVETDSPAAIVGSSTEINGLKWIVAPQGSAKSQTVEHPNGVVGIQKIEQFGIHSKALGISIRVMLFMEPPPQQASL